MGLPIRVAYDHQIFGWQRYGGISRYFYELAKCVAVAEDFTATVIAPMYVNQYLSAGGVDIKGMRIPANRRLDRAVVSLNGLLSKSMLKSAKPDLVHETYYQTVSSAMPSCPAVVTVHDMIHERLGTTFAPTDGTARAKRAAVARADHLICVSECSRRDLMEVLGTDSRKISVIHHGCTANTSGHSAPLKVSRPFFLYVGDRSPYKNFSALLRAFAASSRLQAEFDLLAFGGGAFTTAEAGLVDELGLELARVRQVSGPDALLGAHYRAATALVFPSLYEGFGIPPLEAMAYGCPVVCSDSSSIPEVVGDAGLYFDPRDVESLRSALERVASSSPLRSQLVTQGRERVKAFSWRNCAEKTMAVYRALA